MKVVVDTNIVFSGLLNPKSRIGELLIKSKDYFTFYSLESLLEELEEHQQKILKISKYSDLEYLEAKSIILSKINVVDDESIPKECLLKAESLSTAIDPDDTIFLALSFNLNAFLWTGDKKVANGLKKLNVDKTISTEDIYKAYLERELNK
ncbi:putative toxin-antitoxin system toxin component, PIN family [uncultured Imperialibacter sp.]|uniref:putative toxin-antitoxin system toxin component, PIN family n=1 Tax=uncultured Imperialibacter sp. TaxID=1672639 RepID=UPI0030D9921B|tara:strand:+ start:1027 stop:1479 length:453 start_codon:yes stop_codon:yes gene_type:complete